MLFKGFDMEIGPIPKGKCEIGERFCRCQIVIPGTIHIPDFAVAIYPAGSSLNFCFKKNRNMPFFHPHFSSEKGCCLGGYQDAVDRTLKVFNIIGFLMVMADYIHSFNVHSMLISPKTVNAAVTKTMMAVLKLNPTVMFHARNPRLSNFLLQF